MPKVLDCLDRCDIEYAILHGAERVRTRSVVSDIDVVVGIPPEHVIRTAQRCFAEAGLVPIMEWPYDIGKTLTVFLATSDGREAVQLDMLHDRWGLGKYAVRSNVLLRRSSRSDGLAVVAPTDELVYLLRKRMVKGDDSALSVLRERASQVPAAELGDSIRSTLSSFGRRSVNAFVDGEGQARAIRPVNWLLNVVRGVGRFFRPTGFWIHCSDPRTADAVMARFSGYLPNAATLDSTSSSGSALAAWRRLRPGIVITHGRRPRLFRPDAVIAQGSPEEAVDDVMGVFRSRTARRLGAA